MKRRHSSQSKMRGVYSETVLPDNVKPDKQYLQGPTQEAVLPNGIMRISTQAVIKLAALANNQVTIESRPSSRSRHPRQSVESGPAKAVPKVFEPFDPIPGRVPRHVAIQRVRRKYESVDLNQLLDSSPIDMDKRGVGCLEVINYSMEDFSGLAWHFEQSDTFVAAKGLTYHKGKWRFKSATAESITNSRVKGKWTRSGEEFELHKLYIWLCFEDPTYYFQTLLRAFAERDRSLALIQYNFIVDNMDQQDVPDMPQRMQLHIAQSCNVAPRARYELASLQAEVNSDYKRTLNKLLVNTMVQREQYQFPVAVERRSLKDVPYRTKLPTASPRSEQVTYLKPNEVEIRHWPSFPSTVKQFCFNSLLVHQRMPQLLYLTNCAILSLAEQPIFDYSMDSAPFYLDQFTARQENCILTFGYYLRDSWMPSITQAVRQAFKDQEKGWYNLKETTKTGYEIGKLRKLIKMLRLKIQDALKDYLVARSQQFVNFIVGFRPDRVYVESAARVTNFFELKDMHALFFTELTKTDKGIFTYSLQKDSIVASMTFILNRLFSELSKVPDLQPLVLPQFFPSSKLEIYIKTPTLPKQKPVIPDPSKLPRTYVDQDVWVWDLYQRMVAELSVCSVPLDQYLAELKKIEHLTNTSHFMHKLRQIELDHKDVYYIKECLDERRKLQKSVDEYLPDSQHVGIYRVTLSSIKEWLVESIGDNINSLVGLIYRRMREQTTMVLNRLIVIDGKLAQSPADVESLMEAIHFTNTSQLEIEELGHLIRQLGDIYDILEEERYRLNRDELDNRWNMLINVGQTRETCIDKAKKFKALKQSFEIKLRLQHQEFMDAMRGVRESVIRFVGHNDINKREEYYKTTTAIAANLTNMQEQANTLRHRQELLGMPVEDYTETVQLEKQFQPYVELWSGIYHWRSYHETWVKTPLHSFELVNPQIKVEKLLVSSERLADLFRTFHNGPLNKLSQEIRQELLDFRPKLPLLIALKRQGLMERHFREISDTIKQTYKPDESFRFEQALEMGMLDYTEPISQISQRAFKEHNIERILDQVRSEVGELRFVLSSFPNIRGEHETFIVMNLEQIAKQLDYHMMTVQSVQYNPTMRPFMKEINELAEVIRISSETVDEWTTFQRHWVYLSPIFDSPELQKQIPQESKKFKNSDHMWKAVMAHAKNFVKVVDCCIEEGTYQRLRQGNKNLEAVRRQLTAYLQLKREGFARFYFLSDFQLLELLSKARKVQAVQPYLKRVFENVEGITIERETIVEVEGRYSQKIPLFLPVRLHKIETENWFKELDERIKLTVRASIFRAFQAYEEDKRVDWMLAHPAQAVLAARQTLWTASVEKNIDDIGALDRSERQQLNLLIGRVRSPLTIGQRVKINCLIVVEVHNLDILNSLKSVAHDTRFEWQKHLRHYSDNEDVFVDCMLTHFPYGYEYLGTVSRLVATPLTDRCYITLMGALKLGVGGAAYGPPGTGKTQTTKDLAKILAKQCVVLNCSGSMDHLTISKFFRGLANSGAWTCLDEFNRINPEVLSVVAEQLSYYFAAKVRKELLIEIDGQSVMLDWTFSVFVTMNPGIAGRAQLPENLKALFKSVAMMVPDLWMIAEIILYSHGFSNCRELAKKIVATFKLASEQLSIQQHYDYGMRAIKSVLSLVGRMRMSSKQTDEVLVLSALRDSTLPKLVKADVPLFQDILKDIFGQIETVSSESQQFVHELNRCCDQAGLTLTAELKTKMLQLHSTTQIRHGIMLVGDAGTGKTQLCRMVAKVMEATLTVVYPKAVSIDDLFGSYNDLTREWSDGIVNVLVRQCLRSSQLNWIVMDGPVDPMWVQNFNTVLDDSKKLCLNSGQSMIFTDQLQLMFELDSLQYASPATVSRCGMIYMEATTLPLQAVYNKHVKALPLVLKSYGIEAQMKAMLPVLLNLIAVQQELPLIKVKPVALVQSCLKMLDCFTVSFRQSQFRTVTQKEVKQFVEHSRQLLVFCAIWTIGSLVQPAGVAQLSATISSYIKLTPQQSIFDVYIDTNGWYDWRHWSTLAEHTPSGGGRPYHKIQISSNYSIRTNFLLSRFITNQLHCLNVGSAGVGKSQTVLQSLSRLSRNFISCLLNFTAWTSCNFISTIVESKLEKKNKKRFVPPNGRTLVVSIDDVDMPRVEEYGSQPPLELLRQLLNQHGWYRNQTFASLDNTVLLSNLTVSQRVQLSHRFLRKFIIIGISDFSQKELVAIFSAVVGQFYTDIDQSLKDVLDKTVNTSVRIYKELKGMLLPTPNTLHYNFTSRDLYRLYQGLCLVKPTELDSEQKIVRLYIHELRRTFEDRLSTAEDIATFQTVLAASLQAENIECSQQSLSALFYTFASGRNMVDYRECGYIENLVRQLENYQDEYNYTYKTSFKLVYFRQACQHIARIAKVLSLHRGNIILCGLSGSGRESLAKMAIFVCSQLHASITSGLNYTFKEWRTDLKDYLLACGLQQRSTTFILTESQLTMQPQMQDLNTLLTSLDLPVIYSEKDMDDICQACRTDCIREGLETTRINLYSRFVQRLKGLLHLVLLLSPQHKEYALRIRSFPSLTSACVFDWFHSWPEEALHRVAKAQLTDMAMENSIDDLDRLAEAVKQQYLAVRELNSQYECQSGERYYITPNSFLGFLEQIKNTLNYQHKHYQELYGRYFRGLEQINRTQSSVDEMRLRLKSMQPKLIITQDETNRILVVLTRQNEQALKMQAHLSADQVFLRKATADAKEMQAILQQASRETDEKLKLAWEKAQLIRPTHIAEIRALMNPSQVIRLVLTAVVILIHTGEMIMDKQIGERAEQNFFETAKRFILSRDANSLSRVLMNYAPQSTKPAVMARLEEKVLHHPRWNHKEAMNANKAIYYLYIWVDAIVTYHRILKQTQPIRDRLVAVTQEIADKEKRTLEVGEALQKEMQKIRIIQKNYNDKKTLLQSLERDIKSCSEKLERASKLTEGLKEERVRWAVEVERLSKLMGSLLGDSLVLAGTVSFGGFYSSEWREVLAGKWRTHLAAIPHQNAKAWQIFFSPDAFANQKRAGLPMNDNGFQNAAIMQLSLKKCLFIDPQSQAASLIKSLARNQKLQLDIVKSSDPQVMRLLEKAVQFGTWVLITQVGRDMDQLLQPYLNPCFIQQNSQQLLVVWEKAYFYHPKFRVFLRSDERTQFSPETCNNTTVVNFSITPDQLYQQMLSLIVSLQAPSLEEKKAEVLKRLDIDEKHLQRLSDDILDSMAKQEIDELLSTDAMIVKLQTSRKVHAEIMKRYTESRKVGAQIEVVRNTYSKDAKQASDMFFVVSLLRRVSEMYQVSLEWYTRIYSRNGRQGFREYLWSRVALFLEEKHRLLAALLFCELFVVTDKQQWRCLYETGVEEAKQNPTSYISSAVWQQVYSKISKLEQLPQFVGLYSLIKEQPTLFKKFFSDAKAELPAPYNNLPSFDRILLVNCLRPELTVSMLSLWVGEVLGQAFVRPVLPSLSSIVEDIDSKTPALLIASSGTNIYADFMAFAQANNMMKRIETISLGQGQSERAEFMIPTAVQKGNWVLMENCHLSLSWMPRLVTLMEDMENHYSKDFKLFLSTKACSDLPSYLVRNCVKLNVSQPLDQRIGMTRVYSSLNKKDLILDQILPDLEREKKYRNTLYCLALLHCTLQERKKYIPVGWNIPYAFTLDDLLFSQRQLKIMSQSEAYSLNVLRFLVGEINYGGRITHQSDYRLLQTITESYLQAPGAKPENPAFVIPNCNVLQDYMDYIQSNLPVVASPQRLGLHPNVLLVADQSHNVQMMNCLTAIYHRQWKRSQEETPLRTTIAYIKSSLPKIAKHDHIQPSYSQSFNVLLLQEIERYSTLLNTILQTLDHYESALQGKCLMTDRLLEIQQSLTQGKLPKAWASSCYYTSKQLGQWLADLLNRLRFINRWIQDEAPVVFWMGGLFLPQSLFAVLIQNYARKHRVQADFIQLATRVVSEKDEQDGKLQYRPENGYYINGVYLQACSFDRRGGKLVDPEHGQLIVELPAVHLVPYQEIHEKQLPQAGTLIDLLVVEELSNNFYKCPLYKVADIHQAPEAAKISNLISHLDLPTDHPAKYWTTAGAFAYLSL